MPNRIIKENAFLSDRIASLSDFEFRLWVGLITQADDAGRGDARPAIIKGHVFALRDRVTIKDIDAAVHALAAAGCVSLYTVGGKPYYEFPSWSQHQRIRDCKPKYPGIDEADLPGCGNSPQIAADCGLNPIQSNPNPNPNPSSARTRNPSPFEHHFDGELLSAFEDWLAYKQERRESYKETGLKSLITQIENSAKEFGDSATAKIIRDSMASGYRGIVFDRLKKGAGNGRVSANADGESACGYHLVYDN